MKATDYRQMSLEELRTREEELRANLFRLRTQAATKELENVSRINQEKRELARVLTVMNELASADATSA